MYACALKFLYRATLEQPELAERIPHPRRVAQRLPDVPNARDRVRNDIEYQVNLKSELEIGHLHEKVDHFHQEVMRRLSVLEKASLPATRP